MICSVMDEVGPDDFVFGCEESHGYLVGQYCRDKDGAVAGMLMSELVADVKARGMSMFEHLDELYTKFGYVSEDLITIRMEGSDGMARMQKLMDKFRSDTPNSLAGLEVKRYRDYQSNQTVTLAGGSEDLPGPSSNLVIMETEVEGNYVAARPSGTEPKVKFYLSTHVPASDIVDLEKCKAEMKLRIEGFTKDLNEFANSV